MKYLFHTTRAALAAVLVFYFSNARAQIHDQDSSIAEMNSVMKLDTVLFIENQIFENVIHSLSIGSYADEMLVFNYFPISRIDTFYFHFIKKQNHSLQLQKVPIPANEYLHLKRFSDCSGLVFNESHLILCFFNKFIVFSRKENGQLVFSHAFGHSLGYFSEFELSGDTLLAVKCAYSSSSRATVLCKFNFTKGELINAQSSEHPYIEFAVFDATTKWICISNKRTLVSNAMDDTIQVFHPNNEISKFALNLGFDNPDFKLDSLRGIIVENETREWINELSEIYYFESNRINFIQLIDSQYLLIRYVRPGKTYNNRTYYALAKLIPDFSGIEEYIFKDIPEFVVPKDIHQFIDKDNFDFFSTSALMDLSNRNCVLVKAAGKTQKYGDTRANLFLYDQTYLKKYDPVITLYFYHFTFH